MAPLLLVRYGELTLKSPPVRREFERTLRQNVLEQFTSARLACRLRTDMGHLYVEVDDAASAARVLGRIFGITSVSTVVETTATLPEISAAAMAVLEPMLTNGKRFAIRARRTGQHSFTSQQLAAGLGAEVLEHFADRGISVDLEHPDVELAVEVRDNRAYLSTGRSSGPGGLPLGVAGRVVALVDGPRGALGAYLMMKRGCRVGVVSLGEAGGSAQEVLRRFDPKSAVSPPAEGWPAAEQRLAELAEASRADAVVLPIPVDGYPDARERWGERVLFSPTVGLSEEEVEARWLAVVERAS